MREWIDLGSGWAWIPVPHFGETHLRHICPDGKPRIGNIEETHTFVSKPGEPLTITPSVICECGAHGWIENGKWKPA